MKGPRDAEVERWCGGKAKKFSIGCKVLAGMCHVFY